MVFYFFFFYNCPSAGLFVLNARGLLFIFFFPRHKTAKTTAMIIIAILSGKAPLYMRAEIHTLVHYTFFYFFFFLSLFFRYKTRGGRAVVTVQTAIN